MRKIILVLIVFFMVIGMAFSFDINEEMEQFQFTYFNGILDMEEGVVTGITCYPVSGGCFMYMRDFNDPNPDTNTQVMAYGQFKYDSITNFLYLTLIDQSSEVIKLELDIVTDYVLNGVMKFSDGSSEWVTLVDRYYLIVEDQVKDLVEKTKDDFILE